MLADYLGGELLVEQGGVHGQECLIVAVFDGAFAVAMNQNGALLSLGGADAADVDKSFNDIVEGVYVVVVEYQTAARVFQHCGIVLSLGRYLGLFHGFLLIKQHCGMCADAFFAAFES